MPAIPAVDPSADYQFVSRSAGNTPEKIKAALESEGIFIKDISEQTDDLPAAAAPETPVEAQSGSTPAADEPKPGDPAVQETEAQKAARKAAPGVKERQKARIAELTSEASSVKAAFETEKQKREQLERELADLRAGKSTPVPEVAKTPPTVVTTAESPAEAKPRPKRPGAPKEEDFWDQDDPAAAYRTAQEAHEAAVDKYEEDLTDWRIEERERVKRATEAADRQREATETFRTQNEADQRADAERYNEQRLRYTETHPDYHEKVTVAKPFNAAMIQAAYAMEDTAAIAYWLATHPEEAERITKATDLPKNPTQSQINRAMKTVFLEYGKIEQKIAAEDPPEDEGEAEVVTGKPVAAAPAPVAPAVPVAPKKFTPVQPVGGRGSRPHKTLAELEKSNDAADMQIIRDMPLDEYRKRKANGT